MKNSSRLKLKSMADPFSILPIDIIFDILTRLPLKTISQCKWVSKSWYNLVLNPRFAEFHFSKCKDDFPCAIFPTLYSNSYLIDPVCLSKFETSATAYDLNLKQFRETFTMSNGWNCFEVVGTVNGLVCFSGEATSYYVVNPITRDYTFIPESPKISVEAAGSGFGFDSVRNEYKIIRILHDFSETTSSDGYETEDDEKGEYRNDNESEYGNVIEIYTMGSGIWREIQLKKDVPFLTILSMRQSNVFVDGCLHWSPNVKIKSKYYKTIVSFGMGSEEFNLIKMLSVFEKGGISMSFDLIVLNDCLCIITDRVWCSKDVWTMKKYGVETSWVKEYTIHPTLFHDFWQGFHEVIQLNNNNLLLVDKEHNLIYYDCEKKIRKQIMLHDLKGNRVLVKPDFPVCVKGSLLSPKAIDSNRGECDSQASI